MKIICTLGLLITWLLIAFLLGLIAGDRLATLTPPEPVATQATWHAPLA